MEDSEGSDGADSGPSGPVRVSGRRPVLRSATCSRSGSEIGVKGKRPGQDSEPGNLEEVEESDMRKMRSIGESIRNFVFAEKGITKAISEFVLNRVSEYEEILMRGLMTRERDEGRIEVLERENSRLLGALTAVGASAGPQPVGAGVSSSAPRTFAAALGPAGGLSFAVVASVPKSYALVVKAAAGTEATSDAVKEKPLKGSVVMSQYGLKLLGASKGAVSSLRHPQWRRGIKSVAARN